jgi:hypothetical protein
LNSFSEQITDLIVLVSWYDMLYYLWCQFESIFDFFNPIKKNLTISFSFSYLLGEVQLSLCGNLNKQPPITDEIFNAQLIPYETFANNPSIINDPNLVVRIAGKYVY